MSLLCYSAYLLMLHSSVHSVHLLPDIQTENQMNAETII